MNDRSAPPRPRFGLALGGGSVFGYAHVGVLEALDEAGLQPDRLAGTSAGAIAATLYAFGVPVETIGERFATMTWRQITDLLPGRLGLFSNGALGALMHDLVGPARIEDARIPLAITATDIETGERVVFREGPAAEAVRASACIPGLYAPVEIDGRRFVDGGLLDNVPVAPLRDDGAEVVVGVSLMADVPYTRVRRLPQVLVNAASFALRESTRLELDEGADLVIRPDLSGRASWSLDDLPGVLDAGRRATTAALPAIQEALLRAAGRTGTPAPDFARRLAEGLRRPSPETSRPALRVSPVQCDAGAFCAFAATAAAPAQGLYLVSIWHRPDHLLVRVESSTFEERVRVPLHEGQLGAEALARGLRDVQDEIELDLRRMLTTTA